MTAYTMSAQAILRNKIARLERLLTELNQHEHEMRTAMSALAALQQGVSKNEQVR